jgi:anti-anti-sigma factor
LVNREDLVDIQETKTEKGICFSVRGSLSATQNSSLRLFESVSAAVGRANGDVEVDMEKVVFIDSLSIGLLVGVLLKCQEKQVAFRLRNTPEHITKILDATNLKKAFPQLY